ncbi:ATP-binding protein [Peribacillus frigoritolerans]|uniref:ATP-binding protein n=1 Tax=Peribacillus frigoritolerans TaxID=450367 RepID=UPI00399F50E5
MHTDMHFPEAIYNKQPLIEYQDNPLIEALPPILSMSEVARLMTVIPPFNEEERQLSNELRFHCLQRTFDYFQPFEAHLALERKISAIIRQGYINRNPLDRDHAIYMNKSYQALMQGKMPELDQANKKRRVQGFSIIGVSGIGKSTGIERVLNIYPQVLRHSKYNEKSLVLTQVPWLKLECPSDGSTKGLCNAFFMEMDKLLGTDYFARHQGKTATNTLLPLMGHIARANNLGVLIVDEIQHLSLQKSGGKENMLNFFVTLVNTIGIPVILIGTNKAFDILNGEFRQALRGTGQGNSPWQRMERNKTWDLLMTGLWEYQWTKHPVKLDDELKKILYDESQGILDLAKKIFYLSQMDAIFKGTEKLTGEMLRSSARNYLKLLKPMLDALRSGDKEKLRKYEDLKPVDFDEYVEGLKERIFLENFMEYEAEKSKETEQDLRRMLVAKLAEKIRDSKIVQDSVKTVFNTLNVTNYDFQHLYDNALQIAEEKANKKMLQKKKSKTKGGNYEQNDLRRLLEESIKNQRSVYDVLNENDLIGCPYEDFEVLKENKQLNEDVAIKVVE